MDKIIGEFTLKSDKIRVTDPTYGPFDLENKVKIKSIFDFAKGLNIEGGYPWIKLMKDNQHKLDKNKFLWINLILVLDAPLFTNILFDDLLKDTKYPMLENRIEEINEHHFMASFLMILKYYIINGRKLTNKKEGPMTLGVHIHQDINCKSLIKLIDEHLTNFISLHEYQTVNIRYLCDNPIYMTTNPDYKNLDILISLSQCAGMKADESHKNGDPGTLYISNTFVPYSIDYKKIYNYLEYRVNNDLITRLEDILNSEYNEEAVTYVNKNYVSFNPDKNKKFKAHILTKNDFIETKILQVDKLWNPEDKEEEIIVI